MKVFQVDMEYETDMKEIRKETMFVSSKDDDIMSVCEHFKRHCYEYEKDLKAVMEVLTVVEWAQSSEISEKLRELYLEEPKSD